MLKALKYLSIAILVVYCLLLQALGQEKKYDSSQEAVTIQEVNTVVRFENDGSNSETVRQRAKIQNEAGLKLYGMITFSFIAGDEFSIDTVEVHKSNGSIVKAGPSNIQEVTPEVSRIAPMYSDLRQKVVTVPGLNVGDEVVSQYSSRRKPLVPNQFWYQYSFAQDNVILSENVEVSVPKGRKVSLSYQPDYKPSIKDGGNWTVYQWHGSNQRPADDKRKAALQRAEATGKAPPPSLELSTFESWQQVGSWYWGLQRERATPTPRIKAKALDLTKGLDKQEDKIRALYKFVAMDFRYISLDFGIGRYQPHAADEVLANNYGDCKDKHTLLAALLEAAGIQAFPALINTRRSVDPAVPSPAQFDHVITVVPAGKDFLFLDTTAEVAPYGFLLSPLRHKKALVLSSPGNAQFVETPADPPFKAQEVFDFHGKIDESGAMDAEVSYFLHGDTEVVFKSAFRQAPPSQHQDIVHFISLRSGFGGDVSNVKVTGLDDLDNGLRINYHYHRKDYFDLHEQSPKKTLPLAGLNLSQWDEKEDSVRLYPSTLELTYKCRIELPPGITVQTPLPVKLDREYAHYQSTYSAEKNQLSGERKTTIITFTVEGAHRQDYEAFRRAVEADEAQQMVLHLPVGFVAKSASPSTDVDELARQAEIEYRERDFTDALTDYRKVAELDPKHKSVWTQIALSEIYLRRFDQAVNDFQKALEMDPFDAQAHTELGAAYLALRKYEAAVPELRKAVEIDPLNHRAHFLLGWYYVVEKKDYAAAVGPLEKALSTEAEGFSDDVQIRDFLSNGYFKTGQLEKAVEVLKNMAETSSVPIIWNNAAYRLAENNYRLDLAREYADTALRGIYEHLNHIQPDSVRGEDLAYTAQLALTWDTLGWVHFKSGNLPLAEKYVRAAWILAQQREVGEHLGEIYEKMNRTQDALRFYAMAAQPSYAAVPSETAQTARQRLIKLAGRQRAEQMINQLVGEPSQLRTIHLGKIAPAGSKGEFYFVFAGGSNLVSVQLIGGDERLREELSKLGDKLAASTLFPEGMPQKLVRQGVVNCSPYAKGCDLVFLTSDIPPLQGATSGAN